MKKGFLIFGFIFGMLLSFSPVSFAQETSTYDVEKIQVITEIGTLSNSGKSSEALKKCTEAIKKYPQEADLYYWSGTIKSDLGNHRAAIKDYDQAIKLNPTDGNVYVMRGISKSEISDYTGAVADFNKAILINPKDSSAYSMRACVKLETGDLDGAVKDLKYANQLLENEEK